ncbi:hypothetical protein COCC4DRAFT_65189 [Bipolaris maydis ATCC 48331]|uniref:Uncharacterized protein n=2 Tax=Cochliobolus heterostrophus TaxID=5016 RepID=M2U3V0_COCH5|nr:uncharacterized protein COCC4DRAFT_65189 [Bipolaris maydis ATCC 48331]EMD88401.1 hypothetical protein COCHEDRAFT_1216317 [Bipolaris maydis C5]KAH7556327.1 hypothetical protein BM1_05761 [Bipolaris maydis]ENI00759.1 hypothetical protein COCC4DRAFT_65189 [Bipolaris maydis ATCC 48331]KAJ5028393.1 hypothetical protein J3E73DRAFT_32771 [Bipolaris maydis]KAJ5063164.1 hypothetical protein J3E74DRAFT_28603 [Bipolaris maydis]
MSLLDEDDTLPQFVVDDKPTRPWIKQSPNSPSFDPGDRVFIKLSETAKDGPYLVETFDAGTGQYTLCLDDGKGTTALGGKKFVEESLLRG